MLVVTSSGERDINPGDTIQIKSGFLPEYYDNTDLIVVRIETYSGVNYPFVHFFHQEYNQLTKQLDTIQDEESAISGDIIL